MTHYDEQYEKLTEKQKTSKEPINSKIVQISATESRLFLLLENGDVRCFNLELNKLESLDIPQNIILNKKIDVLNFTTRTSNCLKADGIFTVGKLLKKSEKELQVIPHLGMKSLHEIKTVLSDYNLSLNTGIN